MNKLKPISNSINRYMLLSPNMLYSSYVQLSNEENILKFRRSYANNKYNYLKLVKLESIFDINEDYLKKYFNTYNLYYKEEEILENNVNYITEVKSFSKTNTVEMTHLNSNAGNAINNNTSNNIANNGSNGNDCNNLMNHNITQNQQSRKNSTTISNYNINANVNINANSTSNVTQINNNGNNLTHNASNNSTNQLYNYNTQTNSSNNLNNSYTNIPNITSNTNQNPNNISYNKHQLNITNSSQSNQHLIPHTNQHTNSYINSNTINTANLNNNSQNLTPVNNHTTHIPQIKFTKKTIKYEVPNAFILEIRLSKTQSPYYQISVYSPEETFNNFQYFNSKVTMSNFKPKEDIKSKYLVFRKIERIIEDMFFYYLQKFQVINLPLNLLSEFLENISKYKDLFFKECYYCKKTSKFSFEENCFFPVMYKLYDSESNDFYHEGCFSHLCNGMNLDLRVEI